MARNYFSEVQMKSLLIAGIFLAALATPATACLLVSNYRPFLLEASDDMAWDDLKKTDTLPAPILILERVDRLSYIPTDYKERIEACASGKVVISVQWPEDTAFKLDKIGFRFKDLTQHGATFEDMPVVAEQEGHKMRFEFFLFKAPTAVKDPLDLEIEVYAVNALLERGASRKATWRVPVRSQAK